MINEFKVKDEWGNYIGTFKRTDSGGVELFFFLIALVILGFVFYLLFKLIKNGFIAIKNKDYKKAILYLFLPVCLIIIPVITSAIAYSYSASGYMNSNNYDVANYSASSDTDYNEPTVFDQNSENVQTLVSNPETTKNNKMVARIIYDGDVRMRKSPCYINKDDDVDTVTILHPGALLEILDGPKYCDDLPWWKISFENYVGWVAEFRGNGIRLLGFDE